MVEIIPKPISKIPSWLNIVLYFSITILVVIIFSCFILNYFIKKSEATFQDLEKALTKEKTSSEIALEKEILGYQKKIEDADYLLKGHIANANLFKFLEEICHPKVWFSDFNYDSSAAQVEISGETENFQTLGQQLLILKSHPFVKNLNLSGVSIGKEGKISFIFSLFLDSQIFK